MKLSLLINHLILICSSYSRNFRCLIQINFIRFSIFCTSPHIALSPYSSLPLPVHPQYGWVIKAQSIQIYLQEYRKFGICFAGFETKYFEEIINSNVILKLFLFLYLYCCLTTKPNSKIRSNFSGNVNAEVWSALGFLSFFPLYF